MSSFSSGLSGFGDAFADAGSSFLSGISGSLGDAIGAKLNKSLGLQPKPQAPAPAAPAPSTGLVVQGAPTSQQAPAGLPGWAIALLVALGVIVVGGGVYAIAKGR